MENKTYAYWLRAQRRKLKMSQVELEDRAGLGRKYVTHLEAGRTPRPQDETRGKIHSVLGTSDEDLVNEGILERMGSGKDVIYLWPDSATPPTRQPRTGETVASSQALAQIRDAAGDMRWTQSMVDAIVQQVRVLREMQAQTGVE